MTEKKLKILLVDDDVQLRELYGEVFSHADFEVMQAGDGLEGLDLATKQVPDVIFTGIIMPRMDGFTMFSELKKNVATANIPVIISSHLGREEDRQKAGEMGAKDFIIRNTTPPAEVVLRIKRMFSDQKREYFIEVNEDKADVKLLVEDLTTKLACEKCSRQKVLKLSRDTSEKMFEVNFECPSCKE